MVALKVVVRDELGDGEAEMSFPEQHELVEALRLDRQDEPFGESVGASCRMRPMRADRRDVFG